MTDWKARVKAYVPKRLRRALARLRGRPESTFHRVAYTTPRQVVLITTRHQDQENVWPMDWHGPLSSVPPLYGIAANRTGYGADLVRASGVFVVNFVPASWERMIFLCGNVSGRTVDKFAAAGLLKEAAGTVNAPRLAGALGALECRVRQTVEVGDHVLFIGEVTGTVIRDEAPRLHHVDARFLDSAGGAEAAGDTPGPSAAPGGFGRPRP